MPTTVDLSRVPSFYHNYINHVPDGDLDAAFSLHQKSLVSLLETLDKEKWDFRYAEGKWSVKELVQHLIDGERIFCYRALCFSRQETQSLPGFDENLYADHSKASNRSPADLMEELKTVQLSSAQLFRSFDPEQRNASGIANNNRVYVEAIGFIIVGHTLHHQRILQERYL
jgi:uncharacterized damage-inducible protein DinB